MLPSDPSYLQTLQQQYANPANLSARIQLHVRFSLNKYGWHRWVFDQFNFPQKAHILELGCGTGYLWHKNRYRIPHEWNATLTDFSKGMVEETRSNLLEIAQSMSLESLVADAQAIPFENASFDAILAIHMLYTVLDRKVAFEEITRVLKPHGRFFASTMGQNHLKEVWELIEKFDPRTERWLGKRHKISFSLENGAEELSKWFSKVALQRYENALHVTEPELLIEAIRSIGEKSAFDREKFVEFAEFVRAEFVEQGTIQLTSDSGLFAAIW